MLTKKPLKRRFGVYAGKLKERLPSGSRVASKLGGYGRRGLVTVSRFGKRFARQSKGGAVSFFTDPRGYVNHLLFVFLMLFVVAFFGPALYDFSIIAVMGFLGVLKMLLQFFLLLFEFPLNTALELVSGMLNSLAAVIGTSIGTWHIDLNGDGMYTSLYNLKQNVVLEVPNVYLSNNPWDYTLMSYFTNWGSSALPGVTATSSGTPASVTNHAALVSTHAQDLLGGTPDKGWFGRLSISGLIGRIPFA